MLHHHLLLSMKLVSALTLWHRVLSPPCSTQHEACLPSLCDTEFYCLHLVPLSMKLVSALTLWQSFIVSTLFHSAWSLSLPSLCDTELFYCLHLVPLSMKFVSALTLWHRVVLFSPACSTQHEACLCSHSVRQCCFIVSSYSAWSLPLPALCDTELFYCLQLVPLSMKLASALTLWHRVVLLSPACFTQHEACLCPHSVRRSCFIYSSLSSTLRRCLLPMMLSIAKHTKMCAGAKCDS